LKEHIFIFYEHHSHAFAQKIFILLLHCSFTTEPLSIGLNVALDAICQKTEPSTDTSHSLPENGDILGIPEAVPSPYLRSASLRSLKYCNGSYVAHVTPV